jgi:hypothetical protein
MDVMPKRADKIMCNLYVVAGSGAAQISRADASEHRYKSTPLRNLDARAHEESTTRFGWTFFSALEFQIHVLHLVNDS